MKRASRSDVSFAHVKLKEKKKQFSWVKEVCKNIEHIAILWLVSSRSSHTKNKILTFCLLQLISLRRENNHHRNDTIRDDGDGDVKCEWVKRKRGDRIEVETNKKKLKILKFEYTRHIHHHHHHLTLKRKREEKFFNDADNWIINLKVMIMMKWVNKIRIMCW